MRYISTDSREIARPMIRDGLRQIDPRYDIMQADFDDSSGELMHGEILLGVVEVNSPGDGIFEEDIADLKELVSGSASPAEQRVMDTLNVARAMIAVEAIWQGQDSESTLEKIDPLWGWLFANYAGLLQADGDGFYDQNGLILELNLKI